MDTLITSLCSDSFIKPRVNINPTNVLNSLLDDPKNNRQVWTINNRMTDLNTSTLPADFLLPTHPQSLPLGQMEEREGDRAEHVCFCFKHTVYIAAPTEPRAKVDLKLPMIT